MPVWHERTKAAVEKGDLVVVGVIQEQHAERCALFLQWKGIDWPILVDSTNRVGIWAVPLVWAIDASGVLRSKRPKPDWVLEDFLKEAWPEPEAPARPVATTALEEAYDAGRFGDCIRGARAQLKDAKLETATRARLLFLLGCAHRARHDSAAARSEDFQDAIDAWTQASRLAPRNYIYRRRIQQYGPRLGKPYPFYDWVERAQRDLRARGIAPHPLRARIEGSEIAQPLRRGAPDSPALAAVAAAGATREDDASVPLDDGDLIRADVVCAPAPVAAGGTCRVYVRVHPSDAKGVSFDDEAGAPRAYLELPKGFEMRSALLPNMLVPKALRPKSSAKEAAARARMPRSLECEVRIESSIAPGPYEVRGFVVANVCEDASGGTCRAVRRSFRAELRVSAAPKRRGRRKR